MTLQTNALYIMLFARDTAADYHWALYHHHSAQNGTKYHIRGSDSNGWFEEFVTTTTAAKEFLLIGFLRIAIILPDRAAEADRLIRGVPKTLDGVTCRVWVLEAIRRLVDAGIVICDNLEGLEKEAKAFGFSEWENTSLNKQPRPIVDSRVCEFPVLRELVSRPQNI